MPIKSPSVYLLRASPALSCRITRYWKSVFQGFKKSGSSKGSITGQIRNHGEAKKRARDSASCRYGSRHHFRAKVAFQGIEVAIMVKKRKATVDRKWRSSNPQFRELS